MCGQCFQTHTLHVKYDGDLLILLGHAVDLPKQIVSDIGLTHFRQHLPNFDLSKLDCPHPFDKLVRYEFCYPPIIPTKVRA